MRKKNAHTEKITRKSHEFLAPILEPKLRERELYVWEKKRKNYPGITPKHFQCNGSNFHPLQTMPDGKTLKSCEGGSKHSLPIIEGKQTVYPILLKVLNYIQNKTGKKVIVTCGHRCPSHNEYADPSSYNRTSKHMIGAEVDFYVQGMEERPLDVIDLIFAYYKEHSKDQNLYTFYRSDPKNLNVSTAPWFNKEVFIKLYHDFEGRDFDNQHPYPYISIQVRYDPKKNKRVSYSWEKAHKGYLR